MLRTQIQLTDLQAEKLRRVAALKGVSMSEVVREALDSYLSADSANDRREVALRSLGGFRSGDPDVSDEHDRYLTEDFEK